uniref:Vesicle transport protein n=1 Tax=Myripristis murdjan TaxID=586833 RepID=A0A667Z9B6_9TELE
MDKLKRVLSGQDGSSDSTDILEVRLASTLAWGTRVKAFLLCFVLGVSCSILGSCLLWLPGVGLAVFAVLYSVGNLCSLARSDTKPGQTRNTSLTNNLVTDYITHNPSGLCQHCLLWVWINQ